MKITTALLAAAPVALLAQAAFGSDTPEKTGELLNANKAPVVGLPFAEPGSEESPITKDSETFDDSAPSKTVDASRVVVASVLPTIGTDTIHTSPRRVATAVGIYVAPAVDTAPTVQQDVVITNRHDDIATPTPNPDTSHSEHTVIDLTGDGVALPATDEQIEQAQQMSEEDVNTIEFGEDGVAYVASPEVEDRFTDGDPNNGESARAIIEFAEPESTIGEAACFPAEDCEPTGDSGNPLSGGINGLAQVVFEGSSTVDGSEFEQ